MKQQVFELHRETIEMRMVAEQLWQHTAKAKPMAELTQSLGTLRAKLADGFRVSHDELTVKEQHLRDLASKLRDRQRQLKQQRAELNQWLERRTAGIEEQAARLVAREVELDGQQDEIREREAAWRAERRELQARVRQFTRQLHPQSPAALP
jgi:thymidylate synthase ThyX